MSPSSTPHPTTTPAPWAPISRDPFATTAPPGTTWRVRPVVAVLAGLNAALVLGAGGLVAVAALLPLAMSVDACGTSSVPSGALVCTGVPQLAVLVVLGLTVLAAGLVAVLAVVRGGWAALALALGGWLTLAAGFLLAWGVLYTSVFVVL